MGKKKQPSEYGLIALILNEEKDDGTYEYVYEQAPRNVSANGTERLSQDKSTWHEQRGFSPIQMDSVGTRKGCVSEVIHGKTR